ncbi:hypothetical protein [Aquimarina sp. MMG015]|nr:hypothetical protein [Aquimarina sp. MMG015]
MSIVFGYLSIFSHFLCKPISGQDTEMKSTGESILFIDDLKDDQF